MLVTIDRFEGEYAVCEREDRSMLKKRRRALPEGCTEGSRLRITDKGVFLEDNSADRARIEQKMRDLFQ